MLSNSQVPWWAVWIMAMTALCAFIAALFIIQDADTKKTLVIALITITTSAVAFYFGSSSESSKKTDAIISSTPPDVLTADAQKAADALRTKIGAAP